MASTSNLPRITLEDERVTLGDLCFHLRKRREMYLPDGRFATAVAFIEGFNAALDGAPLHGFQAWLAERIRGGKSSIHWAYIVASTRVPEVLEGRLRLDQIPLDQDKPLTDDLIQLIEGFMNSSAHAGRAPDRSEQPGGVVIVEAGDGVAEADGGACGEAGR